MLQYYRDTVGRESARRGRLWRARFLIASIAAAAGQGLRQRVAARPAVGSTRRAGWLADGRTDLKLAWRRLAAAPRPTVAIGMLALAVGLGVAMFTVVDALMLRPAPFPEADRLFHVFAGDERGGRTTIPTDLYAAWRGSPAFEDLHGVGHGSAIVEDGIEPVMRAGAFVSPGLFEMLGARPLLGRTFVAGEGRPGTRALVVLSERLWRSQYGADRSIVGRRLRLSGVAHEVVGVLPDGFRFPTMRTEFWRPMDFTALQPGAEQALNRPQTYVRLAASLTPAAASQAATATLRATIADGRPQFTHLRPIMAGLMDEYSTAAVTALAAAVGLVFLVLCANAANLLVVRAIARRSDYGLCAALGATRGRLLRQAFAETAIVGLAGTIAGAAAAWALVSTARAWLPDAFLLRSLNPIDLDARALAAGAIAALTATGLASVPAVWLATRPGAVSLLRSVDRGAVPRGGPRMLLRALIVGEVALAAALLVSGALLLRSFLSLVHADRGLEATGVVTASMSLPSHRFPDRASRLAFADGVERVLRATPGLRPVALSYGLPPRGSVRYIGPVTPLSGGREAEAFLSGYFVTPDFFRLYRIPILEGAAFDDRAHEHDVVITATLRDRLWAGQPAIGRTFRLHGDNAAYRVVGVAADLRSPGSATEDQLEWYRPLRVARGGDVEAEMFSTGQVMVGFRCDPACPPLPDLRRRIRGVDPDVVIAHLSPLDGEYLELLAAPRAAAALALVFAMAAAVSAGGGLFSVLATVVGRRRRELGIRAALGARPRELAALVFREAFTVAAMGLTLGVGLAWLLTRFLSSLLVGVTPADPVTWVVVPVVIGGIVLAAAVWPARMASSADPVAILRE
jgi:predicted permease